MSPSFTSCSSMTHPATPSTGFSEEWRLVSDGGRTDEEEAHSALSPHPGYARPAAGDRSIHAHHGRLQVDQT